MEILMAFLVVALLLLPVFTAVGHAVAQTDRYYSEAFAMTHAKGIMDSLLFQIPFRCIQSDKTDKTCVLIDPDNKVSSLLKWSYENFFDPNSKNTPVQGGIRYEGEIIDKKGFVYKIRVKCIDVADLAFKVDGKTFSSSELTTKDANNTFTVMKKLILEVRWSLRKNEDPLVTSNFQRLFLIGVKCDLER